MVCPCFSFTNRLQKSGFSRFFWGCRGNLKGVYKWKVAHYKRKRCSKKRNRKEMLRSRRRCKSGSCLDFLRIYDKHFSRLVKGRTEQNSCSKTESPLKRHKSNFFHISLWQKTLSDRLYRYISPFGGFAIVFGAAALPSWKHKKIKGRL